MDLLSRFPFLTGAGRRHRSGRRPLRGARVRSWRAWVGRGLLAAFILFVLGMLAWEARQVEWPAVWRALRDYPPHVLVAAAAMAACGHLLYSGFDLLGRRYTGHRLATLPTMGVTFVSYAFNLNFGAIIGGAAMRLRLYARLGLAVGTIARVMLLSMWTNWLGYLFLAGVLLLWLPLAPPAAWSLPPLALRALGALLLGVALAYVLLCAGMRGRRWHLRWRGRGHEAHLPSARMALLQLLMASGTWLAMTGLLFVLLQQQVAFASVAVALLVGVVGGLVSRVPAGLGVQEAVFVALLSDQLPQTEILAAMLSYRALYYWIPLACALVAYLSMEARAKRLARRG
jgi:glycosyltransferase 2 family protein